MPTERRRHLLYEEVKGVLSMESADELMAYLPPVGRADVATKADLGTIRNEIDAQRAELRGEMAELRGDLAELRGELAELRGLVVGRTGELGGGRIAFRGDVEGGFKSVHSDIAAVRSDLIATYDRLRLWAILTMLSLVGLIIAVVSASR